MSELVDRLSKHATDYVHAHATEALLREAAAALSRAEVAWCKIADVWEPHWRGAGAEALGPWLLDDILDYCRWQEAEISHAEAADVPCTGEVFTTNPPRCVYWVALKHQLDCAEAHRDALAKAMQEIDDLPVRELANGVDSVMRPVTYMAYSAYDVQRIVRSALRTLAAAADIQEKP